MAVFPTIRIPRLARARDAYREPVRSGNRVICAHCETPLVINERDTTRVNGIAERRQAELEQRIERKREETAGELERALGTAGLRLRRRNEPPRRATS